MAFIAITLIPQYCFSSPSISLIEYKQTVRFISDMVQEHRQSYDFLSILHSTRDQLLWHVYDNNLLIGRSAEDIKELIQPWEACDNTMSCDLYTVFDLGRKSMEITLERNIVVAVVIVNT